jgi:hypothetical protein
MVVKGGFSAEKLAVLKTAEPLMTAPVLVMKRALTVTVPDGKYVMIFPSLFVTKLDLAPEESVNLTNVPGRGEPPTVNCRFRFAGILSRTGSNVHEAVSTQPPLPSA